MSKSSFLLGAVLGEMHGNHPGAWRMPAADPNAYTDVTALVRAAQSAERGGLDYIFLPDRVFIWGDLESRPPIVTMEPTLTLAAIAPATRRIGLVTTMSTSFVEPYTLARQLRALDVMSHGRAGWQAIPSYEAEAFANYGRPVPSRNEKYERFNEAIQITQALWGSWDRAAGTPDKATGRFADTSHIRPVNLQGRHVASRGPLQIPPSEQGQPVIFMPFASGLGVQAAALYANGIISMASSMKDAKAQRDMMRAMTVEAGRDADEVKVLNFFHLSVGPTLQEAVERRMVLEEAAGIDKRLAQLSAILGLRLDPADRDKPLTSAQIAALNSHLRGTPAARALDLAREGRTPHEILGHGVLDQSPSLLGTAEQIADTLQEWVQAGAADGFTVVIDDLHDGMDAFVDQVVPVLRKRGLRPDDYQGTTLRDHLGLPEQIGLDPRLT
ncbi:nitrilotriacetate monooxygenase [Actinoplanes sp. OR16]|uniref:NtaA/DmoA family FMN-dependent monooxygenase n=1 Tax=Actinoplanes sp. OR16 TaxID=946334 RepID=UPI000F6C02FA|nr:NtaA/DmoA family FMN-dependent monooxygenase [Actinoplanes sp. OR16]BBH69556.1 nitrilotriacetate monooxygenase [Actinoplanes sp. OR16]